MNCARKIVMPTSANSTRIRFTQILSLLFGVFGTAVILLRNPHAADFLTPPPDSPRLTVQDIRSMDSSDARQRLNRMEQPGGMRSQPVEPGPLWVANLACRVGDYVVSVRRVRIPHYTWDDNPPFALAMPAPPAAFILSLPSDGDAPRRPEANRKGRRRFHRNGQRRQAADAHCASGFCVSERARLPF